MRSRLTALVFAAVLSVAVVPLAEARSGPPTRSAGVAYHLAWLGALGVVGLLARRKPTSLRRAL
jgi:hypothetical protein